MSLDIQKIRQDFPILNQLMYNKPFVYFDNGATAQKPQVVLDKISEMYLKTNSNIHRGVHTLSNKATEAYEHARETVRAFINAKETAEIIFTAGTTASINTVAWSFCEQYLQEGDEVIVSEMEHHANIVPWQMACQRKKATLKVIPIDDQGNLLMDQYREMLNPRVKIVAVTQVSNVLGTINPVKEIITLAHAKNIPVLVDGAQGVQHGKIDVQDIDCDFYVFSGHKVYGPTGIGVLYGKKELLNSIPPYQGGGDMVDKVSFAQTTYLDAPLRFEAGTTNYIGAIAMAEALKYLQNIGIENIAQYEHELFDYANHQLQTIEGLNIYGNARQKAPIFSFLMSGIHFFDTGMMLDKMGIAVRTGTHCAQPLMQRLNVDGTARASLAFYNTQEEIDIFIAALKRIRGMF